MLQFLKISNFLIISIVCIVLIIVLYVVMQKKNKKNIEAKLGQIKKNKEKKLNPVKKEQAISISKKVSNYEPVSNDNPTSKPKISIKKKVTPENLKGVTNEVFEEIVNSNLFLNFSMSELWQDSVLSEVYMSNVCCTRLDAYLKKENLEQIQFESNMIPEIGGILLGRFNKLAEDNFRITLEEFIAIESVNPNLYTLEFCTDSLVKELGDVVDTYPALSVVGWFHTHPGHGLFLSIPDLTIQMGFFKESYQIAMEIDSLSAQLDTGFFTQKTSGKMNNSITNRPQWYSWKSIIGAISQ